MKIRTGFVSNSSSSSFMIDGTKYKSVFDLAIHMIPCREWDNDAELVKKLEENSKTMGNNTPVCFSSCNYRTYIAKDSKGNFAVQTCNNHVWVLEGRSSGLHSEYSSDYDFDLRISQDMDFWYPEYDLFGSEPLKYPGFCQLHFCDLIDVTGKSGGPVCPKCYSANKDNAVLPTHKVMTCHCGSKMLSIFNAVATKQAEEGACWCSGCGTIRKIETYPIEPYKGSFSKILMEWRVEK